MTRRWGPRLATALVLAAPQVLADARFDYMLYCGGCHLASGAGSPPEVPDLREDLDWLASTPEGRSYLARVPGASQVPLSDAALADVFNWILVSYYPSASDILPFSAEEIRRTRYLPLYDPLKARAELEAARP